MKEIIVRLLSLLLFATFTIEAAPAWKLPYAAGESWQMTRGYGDGTHRDYGFDTSDDRYALDFAYPHGCGASYGRDCSR